ncbi:MAG: TA system VapC family ribonuclease toxin [Candidatus Sulfotelmatobacter sp.]
MTAYLLDVNVLIALSWPGHEFHEVTQKWFGRNAQKGWATCPLVEASFVRILSNPAFSVHAVTPKEAVHVLGLNTSHPAHQFWADDLPLADGLTMFKDRLVGHQQVTDAYLLALATHRKGKLATLDKRLAGLVEESGPGGANIEMVR